MLVNMCGCVDYTNHRGEKKMLNTLELELEVAVRNSHMVPGSLT